MQFEERANEQLNDQMSQQGAASRSRRPQPTLKLKSALIRSGYTAPVELEMRFVPGLPGILFLGLPDASLKETAIRIRSAIRAAGFEIPRGKQLIVDISPREEKKAAHGLDLAVCVGFLILSGQIEKGEWEQSLLYGDVRLSGEVVAPEDWKKARLLSHSAFVTGQLESAASLPRDSSSVQLFSVARIEDLKHRLQDVLSACGNHQDERSKADSGPKIPPWCMDLRFNSEVSRLAAIMALGGHPTLLAGPPGTGKSTLARMVHLLRPKPDEKTSREILMWRSSDQSEITWGQRPLLEPHHTTSQHAMVGGGRPVRAGVVTRAHGGTLLMDEVLLFRPEVQESLREPLETGVVKIARGSEWRGFPADFQLIGTTNLCACGKYTPDRPENCHCVSRVRAKFEERLRGPFVDRFQILTFTDSWRTGPLNVPISRILECVQIGRRFQQQRMQDEPAHFENRHWRPAEAEILKLSGAMRSMTRATALSERRRLSVFRLARTLADLDQSDEIRERDMDEALRHAAYSFQSLYSGSGAP